MLDVVAVGGVAAAVVAIWYSRKDARRLALFEHLREVERRNAEFLSKGTQATYERLLSSLKAHDPLSDEEDALQGYLSALDLLAFAALNGVVDARLAGQYVRNMLHPGLATYVEQLRTECDDPELYVHFSRWCDRESVPRRRFTRRWRDWVLPKNQGGKRPSGPGEKKGLPHRPPPPPPPAPGRQDKAGVPFRPPPPPPPPPLKTS